MFLNEWVKIRPIMQIQNWIYLFTVEIHYLSKSYNSVNHPLLIIHSVPGGSARKELACNAGDLGSIPGLRRSPGGGHGNPLQYSCLENPHELRSLARVGHDHSSVLVWRIPGTEEPGELPSMGLHRVGHD